MDLFPEADRIERQVFDDLGEEDDVGARIRNCIECISGFEIRARDQFDVHRSRNRLHVRHLESDWQIDRGDVETRLLPEDRLMQPVGTDVEHAVAALQIPTGAELHKS